RYRFVSRSCAAMLGRPITEIVGRPIVEVIGDEAFRTILPYIQSVLKGECVEFEAEVPYQTQARVSFRSATVPNAVGEAKYPGGSRRFSTIPSASTSRRGLRPAPMSKPPFTALPISCSVPVHCGPLTTRHLIRSAERCIATAPRLCGSIPMP